MHPVCPRDFDYAAGGSEDGVGELPSANSGIVAIDSHGKNSYSEFNLCGSLGKAPSHAKAMAGARTRATFIRVKGMSTTSTKSTRSQKTATKQPQTREQVHATMWAVPSREQIAARAFEIYKKSGCRPGQDEQNWLQAERELRLEARKTTL